MTDIASLGFNIETQSLTRANTELTTLVNNAARAEKAVASLSASLGGIGTKAAANINAASTAFQKMAVGATSAATAVSGANAQVAASATSAATAQASAAAATTRAAAAQTSAAAATRAGSAAMRSHAANTNIFREALGNATNGLGSFSNAATGAVSSSKGLYASIAAIVALVVGGAIAKAADHFIQLSNAIKLAGVAGADVTTVQDHLFETANQNGVAIEGLTTLYRRGSITAKELGKSQNDLLKVVDVVAASLRLQGSTADSAKGALLQLGQAFGTGVVHAEEYNSMLENAYPLLQAAAKGIDGMDGSVAKLTNAVKAGQITSKQFFEGIIKGGGDIINLSKSMNLTVGNSWEVLVNGFTALVGRISDATNVSQGLSKVMTAIGNALTDLSKNKEFLDFMNEVFDGIGSAAKTAWDAIKTLGEGMDQNFGQILQDAIKESIRLLNVLAQVALGIAKVVSAAMGSISDALKQNSLDASKAAALKQFGNVQASESAVAETDKQIQFWMSGDRSQSLNGRAQLDRFSALREAQIAKLRQDITTYNQLKVQYETELTSNAIGNPANMRQIQPQYGDPQYSPASKLDETSKAVDITKVNKKAVESYRKLIQSAQDYIALKGKETDAVGLSVNQANVLTHEQELMNKALMANLPITEAMKVKFHELAIAMADADNEYKSAQFIHKAQIDGDAFVRSQEVERNAMFMSSQAAAQYRKENELLNQAIAEGLDLNPKRRQQLHDIAVATAEAQQETKNYSDAMQFLKQTANDAFSGIGQALLKGQSIWDAFANAATRALDRIISKLSELLVDSLFDGGSSLSNFGSGLSNVFARVLGGSGGSQVTGQSGGSLLSSMPSGGGGFFSNIGDSLSGMWDTTSSWFGNIFGSGGAPDVGSLIASGQTGASAAAGGGLFGSGISGLGALGSAFGVFSGIQQLMSGGGAGSTVGGIGSIIGAGVSLIPGIGQIAGPLIMLGSSLLGGLLGGGPKIPPMPGLNYNFTGLGGANDPNINSLISATGGTAIANKLYSGGVGTGTMHIWNGQQWQGQNYSEGSLSDPNGNFIGRVGGGLDVSGQSTAEAVTAAIFRLDVLNGAIKGVSDNLIKVFTNFTPSTIQATKDAIDFANAYDQLGKTANPLKAVLSQLNQQFDTMMTQATQYGMDQQPIIDGRKKAQQDLVDSFMHDFRAFYDPLGIALKDLAKAADSANVQIQYLIDQGLASSADLAQVQNYYLEQQKKLQEQIYGVTLQELQDMITRLTTGDLSGASGTTQFSAAHSAFQSDLAKALSGDTAASARILGEANNLAGMGSAQYGSSQGYQDLRAEITAALQAVAAMVGNTGATTTGAGGTGTNPNDGTISPEQAQINQLQNIIVGQNAQINTLITKLNQLTDLFQRSATNG